MTIGNRTDIPAAILILVLSIVIGAATASRAMSAEPTREQLDFFEQHIRPVLVSRCYNCHSERKRKREGGLWLDRPEAWLGGGENGAAVVPGDPDNSLLLQALRHEGGLEMPPERQLPEAVIRRFEQWIAAGAAAPQKAAPTPQTLDPSDPVAGRRHWAFQPLDPSLPDGEAGSVDDWAETAVDRYVARRLHHNGLEPVGDADRSTLARRVSFALIGMPPRRDQLEAFLADRSPDAYERFVDRLLNSPHFGERWGRHWMDLARYADSNGLDENFLFREAWRYRNWIIDAVNQDMPYDRFLREQIAGDLLPYDSIEQRDRQRIAAGFLVVGPKVLLGNDPRERIMDVADEQLDTIGKSVLGMTLGCARCHDHKFDPIPTADYYALAGILTSTNVMERRYMLGQQRTMERLVGLGEGGDRADEAYEKYWREKAQRTELAQRSAAALEAVKSGNEAELSKLAKSHPEAVAKAALDPSLSHQDRLAAQQALVQVHALDAKPRTIPPRAMIPADHDQPKDEAIRLAGQFDAMGEVVPRGFLRVLHKEPAALPADRSGRVELAAWLVDKPQGAGRLAARVLANRIWQHLLGTGLVRTADNFGRTGEPPSHPRLLDYLAERLIDSDWSLKALIREIVLSRSFRLSSRFNAAGHELDPENRLLWRANRRRLDPESMRDAMLQAAGQLDRRQYQSTVSYLGDQATAVGANKNRRRTDFPCRSVYLPVIRNDLPEVLDVFDFADPHATTGTRPKTMVATQGLFLLNDPLVLQTSEAVARRVLAVESEHDSERILDTMCRLVLQRPVEDSADRDLLLRYLRQLLDEESEHPEQSLRAWTRICHTLFASSRFQLID